MNTDITELINVAHDPSWLPWAVQYFFLIGLSYAAFLLTVPAFVFQNKSLEKVGRVALLVAVTTGIVAPVALLADLHQPARFMNFYFHFTPGSWMSWGSFFLPVYVSGLLLYSFCIFRREPNHGRIRLLGIITLIAATLVIVYTGSEVAIVKARPLWNTLFVPFLYFTTALSGASGLSLLINRYLMGNNNEVAQWFNNKVVVFTGLSLALLVLWLLSGVLNLSTSGSQMLRLVSEYRPVVFLGLTLFLGMLVPLFLAWRNSASPATGGLAIFGMWMIRWHLFMDVQRIPKSGAGFYDYALPLSSEGLLGMIGSLGLWLLVVMLLTSYLPGLQQEKQTKINR